MTEDRARPVLWRWVFAALTALLLGLLAYLSFVVIPRMQDLFGAVRVELPGLTSMVLNLAVLVRDYWWLFVAGCAGLIWVALSGRLDPVVKSAALSSAFVVAILTGVTLHLHLQLQSMVEAVSK